MSLFCMPSLGSDMTGATLIEWLVTPGTQVRRGDVIAVVETEKGAIEIEVFEEGLLSAYVAELGTDVLVGEPLAEITNGGGEVTLDQPVESAAVESALEPAAQIVPQRHITPAESMVSSELRVSPAARKLAEAGHIELGTIRGSGPEGAILVADVEAAQQQKPITTETASPRAGIEGMRQAIAAVMTRSKREIPHYYLGHTVNLEQSVDWLASANDRRPPTDRLLVGALFIKATALALRDYSEFNGFYEDSGYRTGEHIHIGAAIAIRGGGLVAPALHNADQLSLDELMAGLKDLTMRVRAGRFRISELQDPTVTISSLGDRGVESLYPIIYPPQVACIGFGKVVDRPWSLEDRSVVSRRTVTITLAADHRVSDGRRGARLLTAIGELLQAPHEL